jgi:phospholipid/cholesterol/gamma-HCH transport system ATP-binding protein
LRPDGGRISVGGQRVDNLTEDQLMPVRAHVGMVFQEGALFDSVTVRENVGYRLYEETSQPLAEVDARVAEVLGFVGLGEYGERMPSELSGGQRRRVAIARALTSRPHLILYDEPTTGLDPITAVTIDQEIIKLRDLEGVSSIIVTHQLRDAFYIATHRAEARPGGVALTPAPPETRARTEFLMLRDGRVAFEGSAHELQEADDEYLRAFVSQMVTH